MKRFILALDQGTTSSRALLFSEDARLIGTAQQEFNQYFPKPGWVEHDANEIWESQLQTARRVLKEQKVEAEQVAAIGITNQRETTVLWERSTGKPVHPAIVWQDRRSAGICDRLKAEGMEGFVKEKTGLVIDAYFSATKLKWMFEEDAQLLSRARNGELCFGTIDSWLLWNLSGGKVHATDVSNASRTLIFNIEKCTWDPELLDFFGIPESVLPEVKDSSGFFGNCTALGGSIPVSGVAGDQQSALFGQACLQPGMIKNTYGTGCFTLMNTGGERIHSEHGLLSTIAWRLKGEVTYTLEGSVFVAGAAIQWLRDNLGWLDESADSEYFAGKVEDSDGVVVVPAFTGLGAPYWDSYARGSIFGLSRGTRKEHIIRATLESLAFQSYDLITAMQGDASSRIAALRVDGGACRNDMLMQFQSDLLDIPVERPKITETTALGAAYLAGIGSDLFSVDLVPELWKAERSFHPNMANSQKEKLIRNWKKAVDRSLGWEDTNE
jgi:glycerol kinase